MGNMKNILFFLLILILVVPNIGICKKMSEEDKQERSVIGNTYKTKLLSDYTSDFSERNSDRTGPLFNISHRDIKLGKLVIILAGSGKHLAAAMKSAKDMQCSSIPEESKLVDLISRINGGELEIPPLDLLEGDRNRIVDKVCITISLLQDRFSQQIELIPWALLRFVAMTRFRYGVRSISNLIDLVSPGKETVEDYQINIDHLQLPLNSVSKLKGSSLAYHIWSEDGPAEIVARWNECTKCSTSIRVNAPF